jgi:hypothetical protein
MNEEKKLTAGQIEYRKYKQYFKDRYQKRKLEYQLDSLNYAKKKKDEINKLFGTKCNFCRREPKNRDYQLHEIYYKKHLYLPSYYLNNKDDFICLCYRCHKGIHFCYEKLSINNDEFLKLLKDKKPKIIIPYKSVSRYEVDKAWNDKYKILFKEKKMSQLEILDEVFGKKCFICEGKSERRERHLHEINDKKHSYHISYYMVNKKDFVPLCFNCHKGVHFCYDFLGFSWKDILGYIKK